MPARLLLRAYGSSLVLATSTERRALSPTRKSATVPKVCSRGNHTVHVDVGLMPDASKFKWGVVGGYQDMQAKHA